MKLLVYETGFLVPPLRFIFQGVLPFLFPCTCKTYLTLSLSVGLCPKNPQPISRGLEVKGNEIAAEVNLKFLDLKLQFKNRIRYLLGSIFSLI